MSSYRDDMNDTAVVSDQVLMRLRSVAESTVRVSSIILSALAMLVTDAAVAHDHVDDRVVAAIASDEVTVGATVLDRLSARTHVSDTVRAGDGVRERLGALVGDTASASDEVLAPTLRALSVDGARASGEVLGQRTHRALAQDQARVSDAPLLRARDLAHDSLAAAGQALGVLHARQRVDDVAAAGEELLGRVAQTAVLTDRARAAGQALGVLYARDLVADLPVAAHDELLGRGALAGQVWTAAAGEWAMSRWRLGLSGLAVIDGVLYATTPEGVFALDGNAEVIAGELRTGAIDVTGGRLGTPHAAYLEYELAGPAPAASVTVTTTQSGAPAGYTYPFALRPVAGSLTNARALLGRGLRGRHFAFALYVSGTRAYINDWGVLAAPGSRRV